MRPSETPEVSVIVTTRERREALLATLLALVTQTVAPSAVRGAGGRRRLDRRHLRGGLGPASSVCAARAAPSRAARHLRGTQHRHPRGEGPRPHLPERRPAGAARVRGRAPLGARAQPGRLDRRRLPSAAEPARHAVRPLPRRRRGGLHEGAPTGADRPRRCGSCRGRPRATSRCRTRTSWRRGPSTSASARPARTRTSPSARERAASASSTTRRSTACTTTRRATSSAAAAAQRRGTHDTVLFCAKHAAEHAGSPLARANGPLALADGPLVIARKAAKWLLSRDPVLARAGARGAAARARGHARARCCAACTAGSSGSTRSAAGATACRPSRGRSAIRDAGGLGRDPGLQPRALPPGGDRQRARPDAARPPR